ncbi:hypothetical protein HW555_003918 [Spodoptera exigua]|uniref:Uncharacterized protein n=1 Tax=Spodoptera exigua TaxID=7107 RepID=A0A835GMK1_SPOEX|nr:hypothetical protein HW555_003918 [Spodoptera exigua]
MVSTKAQDFNSRTMLRLQQQLKLLNHVYGAACDNQYLLTTMPQYAKRITISRQMSDETNWHKLDAELLRSLVGGSTWLCNGAILIPMDRQRRKAGPRLKRCTGCGELMSRQNGATKSNSLFAKSGDEDGVCERCRSPMHAPPIHLDMKKKKVKQSAPNPRPGPGIQTNRSSKQRSRLDEYVNLYLLLMPLQKPLALPIAPQKRGLSTCFGERADFETPAARASGCVYILKDSADTEFEQPESDEQSLLDWRDPFTTKVQLANPTDEEDPDFKGHNITMV